MGKQIKSSLLLTLLQQVYSYFTFHLPVIQLFIGNEQKATKRYIILLHMFLSLQDTYW